MTTDAVHHNPEISKRLEKIYGLHTLNMDFRLFRPAHKALLEKLDNPHLKMPPVIHIAGTNGKGSVTAMLRSIYEAAGYRVHMYTSPHLILFNERVVIGGKEIGDDYLLEMLKWLEDLNNGGELTFKEFTCTLAMKCFADNPADITLLEVGLGGRLDITNVIDKSALSVISQIGMDHEAILGDTVEKIAFEKAGIIKRGGKVVVSEQIFPEAYTVIEKQAKDMQADCHMAIRNIADGYETNLVGAVHQKYNMATAIAAVRELQNQFPVHDHDMRQGLQNVNWPARMQNISKAFQTKETQDVWLDSAHNLPGAVALKDHIVEGWKKQDNRPVILVLGIQSHKNSAEFTRVLYPHVEQIYCVDNILTHQPQTGKDLAASLPQDLQDKIKVNAQYRDAIEEALSRYPECRILIAGSIFLAGQVLKENSLK